MEYKKLQKGEGRSIQRMPNRTGIPTQAKWDIEAKSRLSMDDVRVHYHSDMPAKLGALAYTQGTQVYIGTGQERYLRHELGHVVQQKLGLVRANARYNGGPALNTEETLERQADRIGAGSWRQPVVNNSMPRIQRYEDPIVQAAGHITEVKEAVPISTASDLKEAEVPTIVFEAMGTTLNDCEKVYEQTRLYKGNTICVFGLNREDREDEKAPSTDGLVVAETESGDQRDVDHCHLLYVFSFGWNRVGGGTGYIMPFVEARFQVMKTASGVVKRLKENAGENADKIQYKFLYRWLDADAREDNTKSIDSSCLTTFAKYTNPAIMTGIYDWRSMQSEGSTKSYYLEFVKKFNEAEKALRDYYYLLWIGLDKYSQVQSDQQAKKRFFADPTSDEASKITEYENMGAEGKLKCIIDTMQRKSKHRVKKMPLSELKKGNFLPGYYFPETVLMMNEAAHTRMSNEESERKISRTYGSSKDMQDKESMKLVSLISGETIDIIFEPALSVTKPLKNEFSDRSSKNAPEKKDAAPTYWGTDMLNFLRENPSDKREHRFYVALSNVRQSAFNNSMWNFIDKSTWSNWLQTTTVSTKETLEIVQSLFNQKRKEKHNELFKFLSQKVPELKNGTVHEKIKIELKDL